MKKRNIRFAVRLIIFSAAALTVLTYCIYVLTPKYNYGVMSMLNYYAADQSTIDVLAVGTSLTYTDLNTNILWSEFGISAYDLASAEQPFWSTYYYLKEAFKYHRPKLVLLDIKAITYSDDKVNRTRTVLCSYGIKDPVNRLKCIYECVEPDEFIDFALAFPEIHTNYMGLNNNDFTILPVEKCWKGFIEKNAYALHETPVMDYTFNTALNTNRHEIQFFEKILELCNDQDVEIMLVGYPNADYMHDHLFYCTAFEIAEKHGVTGINYNLPENRPDINYSTDCADWQHLNIAGSVEFTRSLGKDIKNLYNLEDHRGDPAYASYDESAELWFEKFPMYDKRNYHVN